MLMATSAECGHHFAKNIYALIRVYVQRADTSGHLQF